jgi:hypothetical protein
MATGYMGHVIKEGIEIRFHWSIFNRGSGFTLSQSWYLVMNMLKQYRDTSIQKQGQTKQALDSVHKLSTG